MMFLRAFEAGRVMRAATKVYSLSSGKGKDKGRDNVPRPSLKRGTRGLASRPPSLARDERDRNPVVRNDGVQDANGQDGADQQSSRTRVQLLEG